MCILANYISASARVSAFFLYSSPANSFILCCWWNFYSRQFVSHSFIYLPFFSIPLHFRASNNRHSCLHLSIVVHLYGVFFCVPIVHSNHQSWDPHFEIKTSSHPPPTSGSHNSIKFKQQLNTVSFTDR